MRHINSANALSTSLFYLLGASFSYSGAVAFLSLKTAERNILPANLQHQPTSAAVRPLSQGRPANQLLAESRRPSERESVDSSAAPQISGEMMAENVGAVIHMTSSPSDANHHPSALRNRGPITAELCRWLQRRAGRGDDGQHRGSMLEIASGTGCHVEAFAKALPNWTFKPTEVSGETSVGKPVFLPPWSRPNDQDQHKGFNESWRVRCYRRLYCVSRRL